MTRTFLIDTDTGSDDAVALVMALREPQIKVAAITVVAGNVPVDQGVRNALYTAELCDSEVPVYRGAAQPLVREPQHAFFFHGGDGMGDVGYPEPARSPEPADAVDVIVETVRAHPGLTLVTLGPLTNIARAIDREPEIVAGVGRCIVMGGAACTVGNVTPAAEFNLWVDPDAASAVFRSGLPIEMVGWELCRWEANLDDDEMAHVRSFGTPLADFALDCNRVAIGANRRQSGDPGLSLPDPVAMAIAIDPSICTRKSAHHVQIETASDLTRGMTVVDRLGVGGDERNRSVWGRSLERSRKIDVCWEIDIPAWKEALYRALR